MRELYSKMSFKTCNGDEIIVSDYQDQDGLLHRRIQVIDIFGVLTEDYWKN